MQPSPQSEERNDRPSFHVMPVRGWLNDPNGPIFYGGQYHLFFQHIVQGCEWGFGIVWGHAVSKDLIAWDLLPPALAPSPGSVDADGCFSGCCHVDGDGRPTILYTGVRLRSNPDCGPLPPSEFDLHLPWIESQCSATCAPGDHNLTSWTKGDLPWLSLPPADIPLAGWRDPFIVQRQEGDKWKYTLLMGSGIKNQGGTALVYKSDSLLQDWQYVGLLCSGNGDTGKVWECPILVKLPPKPLTPRHHRLSHPHGSTSKRHLGTAAPHVENHGAAPPAADGTASAVSTAMNDHVASLVSTSSVDGVEPVVSTSSTDHLASVVSRASTDHVTSVVSAASNAASTSQVSSVVTTASTHHVASTTCTTTHITTTITTQIIHAHTHVGLPDAAHTHVGSSDATHTHIGLPDAAHTHAGLPDAAKADAASSPEHKELSAGAHVEVNGKAGGAGTCGSGTAHERQQEPHHGATADGHCNSEEPREVPVATATANDGKEGQGDALGRSGNVKPTIQVIANSAAPAADENHTEHPDTAAGRRESGHASADAVCAADESCSWFFCISPDVPANPCLYWLGHFDGTHYDMAAARPPLRLDLGDIVYAPNTLVDPQGRVLMWVWLQERRRVGSYDYAGCLSLPRVLWLKGDRLFQEPIPEIAQLRKGESWHDADVTLFDGEPVPIQAVGGSYLDIELTFRRGTAESTGLLLKAYEFLPGGEGSAVLLYHWDSSVLEMVFEGLDPETLRYSFDSPTARHLGGPVIMTPGDPLHLRVLLDYSCLEIFTGTGEVLSTRLYRGSPPPGADAAIDIVAYGGDATLVSVRAYEMSSIWHSRQQQPEELLEQLQEAATAAEKLPAMVAVAM